MFHIIGIAALLSGVIAQALKVVVELIRTRRLNLLRFFDNGGMPSSHTSLVTTLTVGVGVYSGVSSSIFSVTLVFSIYFIIEATGPGSRNWWGTRGVKCLVASCWDSSSPSCFIASAPPRA